MLVKGFLDYLQFEKRYSPLTIISYKNDLHQFESFCKEQLSETNLLNISNKDIRLWVVSLVESGITPISIKRKVSSIKSFYKYLLKEGFTEINPTSKLVLPKTEKKLPEFIDDKEINLLLDQYEFGENFEGIRNKLIIEFLYSFGIRRAELIELTDNNVNLTDLTIKVTGKRNKQRIIPFSNTLIDDIKKYLSVRQAENIVCQENYFFLTKKGNKIYGNLVYRIVKKYLQLVTTLEKKSPHVLRHTFATHMLNNGADLNAIKELLGHANLSATQVYTHNTFEKLKLIYKQAHPRAN
ncbi:MAG: tyrosine recombinase XerC [Marinilabiliales bacterium]